MVCRGVVRPPFVSIRGHLPWLFLAPLSLPTALGTTQIQRATRSRMNMTSTAAHTPHSAQHRKCFLAVQQAPDHQWIRDNYECPSRVATIVQQLVKYGYISAAADQGIQSSSNLVSLTGCTVSSETTMNAILQVHSREYLQQLSEYRTQLQAQQAVAISDAESVKEETYVTPATYTAAVDAVALALSVADAVMANSAGQAEQENRAANARQRGDADTQPAAAQLCSQAVGFIATRPPGHHAGPSQASGFCFLANIAIVTKYLQQCHSLKRIAILDFDVHHGNGTQDVFYSDPNVMFIDVHQEGVWPGSGQLEETGAGLGKGTTINVPLPVGSGDANARQVFDKVIAPALQRFRPEVILVSAGFDAHTCDPLGKLDFETSTYHYFGQQLSLLANELCDGRLLAMLEGGYDEAALAESVAEFISGTVGQPCKAVPTGKVCSGEAAAKLQALLQALSVLHQTS